MLFLCSLRRLATAASALPLAAALPLATLTALSPARALEQVELQLPLLQVGFTVRVSELGDPRKLFNGSSDLAELDRATGGALGDRITELFGTTLPVGTRELLQNSAGTPMFEQALLLASTLGSIDGVPAEIDGTDLTAALKRASANGEITIQSLLQALPGRSATVNLESAMSGLKRLKNQFRPAQELVRSLPAATVDPALAAQGPLPLQTSTQKLVVKHRSEPLEMVVIRPQQGGNGRLVVISHGLWDGPTSFEGWARHLASYGTTVVLPLHPGSDKSQQQAMLSGKVPPPSPQELRLRPLDVSAVIDGVASGAIEATSGVDSRRVVVIGHSWGATTALQLAGATPSAHRLRERCSSLTDPERNISWVLQCSFLDAADRAALADPRVVTAVAVSPPLNLIFDHNSSKAASARVLLVSGSRDWVVPAGPEAIDRFRRPSENGHQLVLADGGDHFNLRGSEQGGPLRALLLSWTNASFAAPSLAPAPGAPGLLPAGGWGDAEIPLVAVPAGSLPRSEGS
ncbi:MAG: alpha/beta hydrolase family protein [Cyanobium sp.]